MLLVTLMVDGESFVALFHQLHYARNRQCKNAIQDLTTSVAESTSGDVVEQETLSPLSFRLVSGVFRLAKRLLLRPALKRRGGEWRHSRSRLYLIG